MSVIDAAASDGGNGNLQPLFLNYLASPGYEVNNNQIVSIDAGRWEGSGMKELKEMSLEELWQLFPIILEEHNPL